ncbi:hypothetical protein HDU96_000755 [Phlyctochytrium bullatum]|nr:hypothetical protein HDU96_000755 [Phlyctochytrium bullatum]
MALFVRVSSLIQLLDLTFLIHIAHHLKEQDTCVVEREAAVDDAPKPLVVGFEIPGDELLPPFLPAALPPLLPPSAFGDGRGDGGGEGGGEAVETLAPGPSSPAEAEAAAEVVVVAAVLAAVAATASAKAKAVVVREPEQRLARTMFSATAGRLQPWTAAVTTRRVEVAVGKLRRDVSWTWLGSTVRVLSRAGSLRITTTHLGTCRHGRCRSGIVNGEEDDRGPFQDGSLKEGDRKYVRRRLHCHSRLKGLLISQQKKINLNSKRNTTAGI